VVHRPDPASRPAPASSFWLPLACCLQSCAADGQRALVAADTVHSVSSAASAPGPLPGLIQPNAPAAAPAAEVVPAPASPYSARHSRRPRYHRSRRRS